MTDGMEEATSEQQQDQQNSQNVNTRVALIPVVVVIGFLVGWTYDITSGHAILFVLIGMSHIGLTHLTGWESTIIGVTGMMYIIFASFGLMVGSNPVGFSATIGLLVLYFVLGRAVNWYTG